MGQSNSSQPYRRYPSRRRLSRTDSEDTVWSEISDSDINDNEKLHGLSKYDILKKLGEGRQGTVFKVRNINNGNFYTMKTIPNESSSRKHRLSLTPGRSMQAEIAILRRIDHQNIVKLIEVVDSPADNTLRLILEFVQGGCIQQLSDNLLLAGRGIPLQEEVARSYFRQLLAALDYLFCHGIIHRDIKPSNLLINSVTGELKLGDFGIAVPTRQDKAAKVLGKDDDIFAEGLGVVGTPAFLPPEYYSIVFGEPEDFTDTESEIEVDDEGNEIISDRKANKMISAQPASYHGRDADVWASGMTLFAFMYGSLPFLTNYGSFNTRAAQESVADVEVIAERILTAPLRFPGTGLGTSQKLRHLLSRMLDKNPAKRAGLHELFQDPWVCKHSPMPRLTASQSKPLFEKPPTSDLIPIVTRVKRVGRKIRSQAHILHHRARASLHNYSSGASENEVGYCA